jgi:hypothetical protein
MKIFLSALFAGLLAISTTFGVLFLFTGSSQGVVTVEARK